MNNLIAFRAAFSRRLGFLGKSAGKATPSPGTGSECGRPRSSLLRLPWRGRPPYGAWGALLLVLSGLWLTGCATAPETGRRQLILLSSQEEMALGLTEFEKLKQQVPRSKDAKAQAMVERVGRRIAKVAPLPNAQWEFVLFESKEANAFCLPGGKVGVYTGILPITRTEAGLATVIGHEVAHAAARHGAERVSRSLLLQSGGQFVNAYLGGDDPKTQAAVSTAYGIGTQLAMTLPHSRTQESEADHIGLLYMARAGYDPEEAVGFWERFAEYNRKAGGGGMWFLRTHPLDRKRIADLKALMPRAKAEYEAAIRGSSRAP